MSRHGFGLSQDIGSASAFVTVALLLAGALLAPAASSGPAGEASLRSDSAADPMRGAGRAAGAAVPARRIVSLVPALTDVLLELDAADRLVARTRYDRQPRLAGLPSVGGTLEPNLEVLMAARPDLVVAWADEVRPRALRRIRDRGVGVYTARLRDFDDLRRHVRALGRLTGPSSVADSLVRAFDRRLARASVGTPESRRPTVAFVVWPRPLSVAGPDTFVSEVIRLAGGRNAFADAETPWPRPSPEALVARDPDVLLLPDHGKRTGSGVAGLDGQPWISLSAVREDRIVRLPADLIERPGLDGPRAVRLLAERLRPIAASAEESP